MAEYLVLARKYRSTTFDEVVGQEPIAQTLKNAIASGRIAHAYLFTGTRGVGKTTMARILAKALNCLSSDGPTTSPCNQCDACLAIARGDDVDVIEIDGASNRGIEEIRELRANANIHPSRCRYKIYYIDEVHMLTKEAFNALLKTLEEPPEHVKFIFATTETEKVPATILSRCQRFDFRNIPTRDIAAHLKNLCAAEKCAAEDDALFRIARSAAGSMRDALSLMDQLLAASQGPVRDEDVVRILGTPSEQRTLAIAQAITENNAAAALAELDAVLQGGVSLSSAVHALADTFRNMMVALTCGPDSNLIELPEQQRQAVGELSRKFTLPVLVQTVGILHTAAFKSRGSSVARALVEAAIVRLANADKFVDPQSLLQRIEGLASGAPVQKKNSPLSGPASSPATPHRPVVQANPSAAAPSLASTSTSAIAWNAPWLAANWKRLMDELISRRQMPVVGLLSPAKVVAFENSLLRLSFEPQHDALRQKCLGEMKSVVQEALRQLSGQEIRIDCVSGSAAAIAPTGTPAAAAGPASGNSENGFVPRAFGELSTAEKTEINKDASVKAVLSLFGGDVVDYRRNGVESQPREESETDSEG